MLTSVTCQVELTPFRLVLMSIGSVPWYWAVCLLCSTLHALPVESNCKGLKDLMKGGGKKQSHVLSNCGKDPKGGQVLSE